MFMIKIFTPTNIYLWWNIGSLISFQMIIQISIGFILSMNYFILNNPFYSSFFIYYNINYGWLMRFFHSNMTSLIFIMLFLHIKRNLKFSSFFKINLWNSGMFMFLIFMMISFLGYSLIWTQMSYWGMMVITNFISSIPFLGNMLMMWIWGNFNINIILINRFFIMHFILPMLLMLLILIHVNILHFYSSTNPLGLNNKIDMMNLNPYSLIKDFYLLFFFLIIFFLLNLYYPFLFNNNDNFNKMSYFNTPTHIEPEWYFLFFYSILRSILNKFNGLMLMMLSILLIYFMPFYSLNLKQNNNFNLFNKILNLMLILLMILISYLGAMIIEYPYNSYNFFFIFFFFFFFFLKFFFKLIILYKN